MKKIMIAFLMILLFSLSAWAQNEIPAPFAKAKEIALNTTPNAGGNYILTFEAVEDGLTIYYILGYLTNDAVIGVGRTINGSNIVAEYHEQKGKFGFWMEGFRRDATSKEAIKFAFQVFKELVAKGLI